MKKVEKYIYLVIALIIVAIIASGTIYIIKKNNQNITLTETELNKYLSYVPNTKENPIYNIKKTNLDSIEKKQLITKILDNETNCWDKQNCDFDMNLKLPVKNSEIFYYEAESVDRYYFPMDYIKTKMQEYYNEEIPNLEETKKLEDMYNATLGYIYQNNYFLGLGGGETDDLFVSYIDSYNASKKELVIYEYVGHYSYFHETLYDYYNNYEVKLAYETNFQDYLKDNKSNFTKYKHTFKKNTTGYYWYSTEIIEN